MRGFVLCLVSLGFSGSSFVVGQSARDDAFFRGVVVDAVTGDSIQFVHMAAYRPDRSWPGATDFDGTFLFRLPKNWMFVEVKAEGYRTERFVVDMRSGWVELRIEMRPVAKAER
jgi:hypothetical protein